MKTIKLEDLVKSVTVELNKQGVQIKDRTVRLILDTYLDQKYNHLANGNPVEDTGICVVTPKFRRSNTFSATVVPTVKLSAPISSDLKLKILSNICTNETARKELAPGMSDEEVKLLKEKLGL